MKADGAREAATVVTKELTMTLEPTASGNEERQKTPKQRLKITSLTALVKKAYSEKSFDDALMLSQQLLDLDRDNFIAQRCIARIYTQRDQSDLAEPIWRRLCLTASDKVEPAVNLARIAHARREWDEMADFADLAARENPEHMDALRLSIQARVKARKPSNLPELAPRLYRRDAERGLAVLRGLGGADLVEAQAAALARLKDVAKRDVALADFTAQCREAWAVGAQRAAGRRDDELAANYLRAVLAFDPQATEAAERLNALSRDRLRRLRMAISSGDHAAALQHAENAVAFNPTLFEARFAIARLTSKEDPDRAAEGYRACAEFKPDDPYYRFKQGLALIGADRAPEAIIAMGQVARGIADDSDPIFTAAAGEVSRLRQTVVERALAEAKAGRLGEARSHFNIATVRTGAVDIGDAPVKMSVRAIFWIYICVSWCGNTIRSIGLRAASLWTQTRRRYSRLRERLISSRVNAAARRIAGGNPPR